MSGKASDNVNIKKKSSEYNLLLNRKEIMFEDLHSIKEYRKYGKGGKEFHKRERGYKRNNTTELD